MFDPVVSFLLPFPGKLYFSSVWKPAWTCCILDLPCGGTAKKKVNNKNN